MALEQTHFLIPETIYSVTSTSYRMLQNAEVFKHKRNAALSIINSDSEAHENILKLSLERIGNYSSCLFASNEISPQARYR